MSCHTLRDSFFGISLSKKGGGEMHVGDRIPHRNSSLKMCWGGDNF